MSASLDLETLAEVTRGPARDPEATVERILALARALLDMDVAVLWALEGEGAVVRAMDGEGSSFGIHVGSGGPLADAYCLHLVQERLPAVIPDASRDLRTRRLAETKDADVGSYVGVPIRLWNGLAYGALCCLSHEPNPSLNGRDAKFLRVLAQLLADELDREDLESDKRRVDAARIHDVLDRGDLEAVFQPVFELHEGQVVSFEALSRFPDASARSASEWFAEATAVGLGIQLELAALETALAQLGELPPEVTLSLNVSPETALSPRFARLIGPVADRIVIEITEHARVESYETLLEALAPLRERGARLAVDDVGAGFASLRHILRLEPDILKLDLSLTHRIAGDPARAALASSLVDFATGIGASIIAEGIETEEELAFLRGLGVGYGQGFYLGRPSPLH